MGQLSEEGQRHGLALRLGQDLERAPDGRAALIACQLLPHPRSFIGKPVEEYSFRARFNLRTRALPTQLVDNAAAGDLEDPRPEAASVRVEVARVLPDREEDVLDDLLRGWAIQLSRSQARQDWTVAFLQWVQGIVAALSNSPDQLFVWNGVCLNSLHVRQPNDSGPPSHRRNPASLAGVGKMGVRDFPHKFLAECSGRGRVYAHS